MFRTITKNPPETTGKKASEKAMWGKATHFSTGDDNEFVGAKSTLQRSFINYGVQPRTQKVEPPQAQISLGETKTDYQSACMRTYLGPPEG